MTSFLQLFAGVLMSTLELITHEPPLKLMQILHSRWAVRTLRSGVELDVFSRLSEKAKTAQQLSAELNVPAAGLELLLNALTSMEFLEKSTANEYKSTRVAQLYLNKKSNLYMGEYVQDDTVEKAWDKLTDSLRAGKPVAQVNQDAKAEEFFPKLAANIFPMNYGTAHVLATELKVEQLPEGTRVLDVAAGSGVWSLPLAERNKNVHVEALDFPAVLEVTKEFAKRHGVDKQFSYISGNWSECELKADSYDIILLGHILHSEGKKRSEELLKECHRCLKSGGKIVIAEMISDNARKEAVSSQLFALNMFLLTEDGCVFTEQEMFDMLKAAGFKNASRPQLPQWGPESPIVIAVK
jgi:ubiquinone/menaquinone biosynthesis C-methylase UbiE